MSSVVMHHYWGSPGGGQLVCASAAYSLEKAGYRPALAGTFSFDPSTYEKWYGIDISGYKVYTFRLEPRAFGLLSRAFAWMPAKNAIKETRSTILFTDEGTYEPLRKSFEEIKIIEYVHFPIEASIKKDYRSLGFYYKDDPYIYSRYGKFPLNVYWYIYRKLISRYLRENPFESANAVMTNSKWTAEVIKLVHGDYPVVVNPPLPPLMKITSDPRPFEERKSSVVMLGRFSEEKRYDWVIREIAQSLKKEGIRLIIFGGAVTPTQKGYMNKVKNEALKLGLKVSESPEEGDVSIVPNASRETINAVMDSSRAFLHATINEHWGIAVAEAMARGLPVVVHKSGGAWSDLAENGENGLGYEEPQEAVSALLRVTRDADAFRKYSMKSLERVSKLTLDNFSEKIKETVKKF
ncbi:MAG: glycosyltransferase [Nitrososphaeria archaeon]|nr:glycosyltransferase [Conexivisphaerales archaeon]